MNQAEPLNASRWICIYPAYMNSKKTLAEGRRIRKDKAIENPTFEEIMESLGSSGLAIFPENKQYSREKSKEFNVRGRVRVRIMNEDGTLVNPAFPTRKSVMFYITSHIPKIRSRAKPADHSKESNKKKGKGKK